MRGVDDALEKLSDGRYRLIRHNQTKWYFDVTGKLTEIRDLQNHALILTYNSDGTLQQVRDSVGRTLQFGYENGRLRTIVDPLQRVWTLHYNVEGRLERIELPPLEYEGVVEAQGASFTFGYTNGKLSQITSPMGRTVSFSYNGNEWIGFEESGGARGGIPTGGCNPSGSFTRVVTYEAGGNRFTYVYDTYGRLVMLFDGACRATVFGWDNTTFRMLWGRSPSGAEWRYLYDSRGNVREVTDPAGRKLRLGWNHLNLLEWVRDDLTPAGFDRLRYIYDEAGQGLLRWVKQLRGVPYRNEAPSYAETEYVWQDGLLWKVKDARMKWAAEYSYDSWGQLTSMTDALGYTDRSERNILGWVERGIDAKQQQIVYRYDSWGRLRRKELPNGQVVEYSYNLDGQLTEMHDATGTTRWIYEEQSGLLQEEQTPRGVVRYAYYTDTGQLQTIELPNNQIVNYTYIAGTGQLDKVYRNGVLVADYEYDDYGRLWRVDRPLEGEGIVIERTEYQYRRVNNRETDELEQTRLVRVDLARNQETEYRREIYVYDALGRVQQVQEYWNGSWYSTVEYTYDYQGQLVREVRSGVNGYQVEYWYDAVGNRLRRMRTVAGQTTTDILSYDDANRVESLNGAAWQHDANGNVVVRVVNGVEWRLEYDAEDNVMAIKRSGALVGRYSYDGLGRLVQEVSASETVSYLYAGDVVVAEQVNGEWVPLIYGLSLLQHGAENQHWSWRGDLVATSAWSDPAQAPVKAPVTDAFGDTISGFRKLYDWNGSWLYRNELVELGGLVKAGQRWYDPAVGRFLQRDFFSDPSEPLSFNLYLYCLNNPVIGVDESGEWPKWIKDLWNKFKSWIGLGGSSSGSGGSMSGGSGGSAPGAGGGGGTGNSPGGSGGSGNGNTIVVQPGSGTTVVINGNNNTVIITPPSNPNPPEDKKPKPSKPSKPKRPKKPSPRRDGCCCGCHCCRGRTQGSR